MLYITFSKVKAFTIAIFALIIPLALAACGQSTEQKKIGIIVPIEHKAMNEIIKGFTETLKATYPHPVKIKIANAQSDMNLERAFIQQMRDEKYDIIVPIGTDASQLSAALIKEQAIVSLASRLTDEDRKKRKSCNIAIVHDEISAKTLISFISKTYPDLSRLALIHSPSEKIFTEVEEAKTAAKREGIQIKTFMVPTLNELYSTANAIPAHTQAIFVLKDHLIVSGISTLEIAASKRKIPLITSDQGSVQEGAAFALGVTEKEIGSEGAKLAASILSGKSPCDLPIASLSRLTVFINKSTLSKENQSLDNLLKSAQSQQYKVQFINEEKGR